MENVQKLLSKRMGRLTPEHQSFLSLKLNLTLCKYEPKDYTICS